MCYNLSRRKIMNYIVFDLEWNQSPGGKAKENPKLPFEMSGCRPNTKDLRRYTR